MSLRLPSLPQVGHGAWLGAYFTGMVRTWGRLISMACVLRGTWLGNPISQHAGFNFLCQWQLWNTETLSASARSVVFSRDHFHGHDRLELGRLEEPDIVI